jgi:hypothetical protein
LHSHRPQELIATEELHDLRITVVEPAPWGPLKFDLSSTTDPASNPWVLNCVFKTNVVPYSEVSCLDLDAAGCPYYIEHVRGLEPPYLEPDVQANWKRFWETSVSYKGARFAFVDKFQGSEVVCGEPQRCIAWE